MSREQLIGLIAADAKFIDERDDITEYVRAPQGRRRPGRSRHPRRLPAVQGREGTPRELADRRRRSTACRRDALQAFVDTHPRAA